MGGETTPQKLKGSSLIIRTPGLESSKKRSTEDVEAVKRVRDLQTMAEDKQAELEEILLQLCNEKVKGLQEEEGSESHSEGGYDSLYEVEGDEQEESEEEEVQFDRRHRETHAGERKVHKRRTLEARPTKIRRRWPSPMKGRRSQRLWEEGNPRKKKLAIPTDSSSETSSDKGLSLTKKPAINLSDLMCRIEKYAKVEDEMRPTEHKEVRSSTYKKGREGREGQWDSRSVFAAVNTVFKEPIFRILPQIRDKPYFSGRGGYLISPGRKITRTFVPTTKTKGTG